MNRRNEANGFPKAKTRVIWLFITFAALSFPIGASAQGRIRTYAVATNFPARDKVLELEIPTEMDGNRFIIIFENADGDQRLFGAVAHAGRHCYEVRHYPEWRGSINYVATSLRAARGRVKEPTFSDDLDIFIEPELMTPWTSNMLMGHTILGWSWTAVLLSTFILAAFLFLVLKKRPFISVILGFLVAWSLMDLRTVIDHAWVLYQREKDHQHMPPFTEIKAFSDQAADMIGHSTWGYGSIEPLSRSFLRYRLAEHPLVRASGQSPAFWITQNPTEGEVVFGLNTYYLVKKNKP